MAYAERVKSPKGEYWRGRFQDPQGRYITVRDEQNQAIRYKTKREAKQAADDAQSDVRKGRWRDPSAGEITFSEWANEWYAGLDLAASTMANLRRHLEDHLLPAFGPRPLRDISAAAIVAWERTEKRAGYMPASVRTWRGTLHTCLEDAVGSHIGANPAARRRGRGKRSGRKSGRGGPEKVITTPLGALLLAERMAILSGRDDEFVMVTACYWCGLRLGELIGLEKPYTRSAEVRVEWQLYEVDGKLIRCPPKDESYGDIGLPLFLSRLLSAHIARTSPQPCPCHGKTYTFRGLGIPRAAGKQEPASHWRRSSFEEMFTAAASGWLPPRSPLPRRPVPLEGEWPGTRVRGRNAQGRAEYNWLPVAEGLTPHGLRHSHRTWLEESRVPEVLAEERLRHEIPGISGIYRHVTEAMRRELAAAMTQAWETALDERLAMSERSPAAVLDGLLRERLGARKPRLVAEAPQEFPRDAIGRSLVSDVFPGRGGRI